MIITIINSARFGEIEVNDDKIIIFDKGLPGLEHLKKYIFLTPERTNPLFFLQSVEDSSISLPVMNPFEIKCDYNPSVNDNILEELNVESVDDILLLNVVVVPPEITKMTVNMAAPIIINVKALKGRQIFMENDEYSIRYPLYETFINLRNGGAENACSVQKE